VTKTFTSLPALAFGSPWPPMLYTTVNKRPFAGGIAELATL
jgi:hypothetical protein